MAAGHSSAARLLGAAVLRLVRVRVRVRIRIRARVRVRVREYLAAERRGKQEVDVSGVGVRAHETSNERVLRL